MNHHPRLSAGRLFVAAPLLALALTVPAFATAAPRVALKLTGVVLQTIDGKVQRTPLDSLALKPGDDVEYDVVASNTGSSAALRLVPMARIPVGTAYVPGSAKGVDAIVQFSIDGGKTWSATPMVTVNTPSGPVRKKADPSAYTTVRFDRSGSLAPGAKVQYSYEVRVK